MKLLPTPMVSYSQRFLSLEVGNDLAVITAIATIAFNGQLSYLGTAQQLKTTVIGVEPAGMRVHFVIFTKIIEVTDPFAKRPFHNYLKTHLYVLLKLLNLA